MSPTRGRYDRGSVVDPDLRLFLGSGSAFWLGTDADAGPLKVFIDTGTIHNHFKDPDPRQNKKSIRICAKIKTYPDPHKSDAEPQHWIRVGTGIGTVPTVPVTVPVRRGRSIL